VLDLVQDAQNGARTTVTTPQLKIKNGASRRHVTTGFRTRYCRVGGDSHHRSDDRAVVALAPRRSVTAGSWRGTDDRELASAMSADDTRVFRVASR